MESDFIVLTSMSTPNKLSAVYFAQLEAASIPYHVYPNTMSSPNDGKLGACLDAWRLWALDHQQYARLILTDAWDVLCYATREQIQQTGLKGVTFAAESNCYPEPYLSERIPATGRWRFVNGGMLTSSPCELLDWCDAVQSHPSYHPAMLAQQWLNQRLAEGSELVNLDSQTRFFYCMFLEDQAPALTKRDGRPFNTVTNTFPCFLHFNGSWPWDPFLEMMK